MFSFIPFWIITVVIVDILFFCLFWPQLWHVEVPGPGIETLTLRAILDP